MLVLTSNLVDQHIAGTIDLKKPRFGYETITRGATITASSTATGFFAQALSNSLTHEYWKPSSLPGTVTVTNTGNKPITYCGIAGHTLGTEGSTVTLQYSDDNSTFVDVASASPSDDGPILFIFPTNNALYWRLSVSVAAASIGVWYVGDLLVMERGIYQGHSPFELSRKTEIRPQSSQAGGFIGRSKITYGNQTQAAFSNLTNSWYRRYFEPMVESSILNPFFFAWHPVPNLTSESLILDFANQEYAISDGAFEGDTPGVAYAWTTGDIRPDNSGPRDLMSVTVGLEGLALN